MEKPVARNRIAEKLNELGKNNKWLAELLDVSEQAVSYWTNNNRQPSWEHLYKIADAIPCDVRELMEANPKSPCRHIRFICEPPATGKKGKK